MSNNAGAWWWPVGVMRVLLAGVVLLGRWRDSRPCGRIIAREPNFFADPGNGRGLGGGSLLGRARDGDNAAFPGLVQPLHRELHPHCYRMLGSTHDADDALQDALLRAWRGLPRFEGRSSLRSWLYTVSTPTSLGNPHKPAVG